MRNFYIILLLLILFTVSSCTKKSPTETDKVEITDIQGTWYGKTSQDGLEGVVEFEVSEGRIQTFKISIFMGSYWKSIKEWGPWSISENYTFWISLHLMGGFAPDLFIAGSFKSNTSSEGSFEYEFIDGIWSATKQ